MSREGPSLTHVQQRPFGIRDTRRSILSGVTAVYMTRITFLVHFLGGTVLFSSQPSAQIAISHLGAFVQRTGSPPISKNGPNMTIPLLALLGAALASLSPLRASSIPGS